MMTAGRPTGPPRKVVAWGRTTGTAASGRAEARGARDCARRVEVRSQGGRFPGAECSGLGADRFPWFHGTMEPGFVATALYTHPTWQGTAAISLPS